MTIPQSDVRGPAGDDAGDMHSPQQPQPVPHQPQSQDPHAQQPAPQHAPGTQYAPQPHHSPASEPAIRAIRLVKTYGEGEARVRPLDGLTLDIAAGCFTAIMGPSGSGKSTLLHMLAGLDTPDSGEVILAGTPLTGLSDARLTALRRDRIGFIFQAFNLVPAMTARENILLPSQLAGRTVDRTIVRRIVDRLGLGDRLHHRPHELSGGQQQRVAVARALVTGPDVIVADEPTGNLDSASGDEVLGLLRASVDDYGQTVVMVTHDPQAAARADRVLLLADGRPAGELHSPTAEAVAAALTRVTAGAGQAGGAAPAGAGAAPVPGHAAGTTHTGGAR
ncbi:ABC transporter ATP-binding protein [Brevibacterium senegalense]|uniref:ABC transporter ATP-binding protein n=1 Tax=Brevibacterium senegalense TaxID=1033736 RepID=UPI0028FCA584|nr:ABC transporter ATP-binding protein [Brevibacterium senegalense]